MSFDSFVCKAYLGDKGSGFLVETSTILLNSPHPHILAPHTEKGLLWPGKRLVTFLKDQMAFVHSFSNSTNIYWGPTVYQPLSRHWEI